MSKRYCIEVLGKMGFAFTQKEFNEHQNISLGGVDYKMCIGDNGTLILVPVSKFDVFDNANGFWQKQEK